MLFNSFIGPETNNREYKVGVIQWKDEKTKEISLDLLKTGKWRFNNDIINTINIYIKKYICKYIVSFTHKLSYIDQGELLIGVSDDGYVKGIPYRGELDKEYIKGIILSTIDETIIFSSLDIKTKLVNNINIEIIKIDLNDIDYHAETSSQIINRNLIINDQKEANLKRYLQFRKMWIKLIQGNQGKINKLFNNEKIKFLEYCRDRNILTKKQYNHRYLHLEYLIDVPNYYDMIANIKIKNYKKPREGSLVVYQDLVSCKNTDHHYTEINDVITLYNFGRYKDLCSLNYRTIKCNKPLHKDNPNLSSFLLSKIDLMNPIWKKNNRLLNLYVIKITIKSNILKNDENIKYYNHKKRKIEECYRCSSDVGPITIII